MMSSCLFCILLTSLFVILILLVGALWIWVEVYTAKAFEKRHESRKHEEKV